MSSDETTPDDSPELSDELARKYDPERLLKLVAKKAGKGEALDASVRAKYEKRFGIDLGHVRVITGEFAEEFNRKRDAYAVTVGSTGMILMGNSPDKAAGTRAGEALLAHELTHVAQAQRGLHNRGRQAEFTQADEVEAHAVEHEVEQGHGDGQHASGNAAQQMEAERNAEQARKDAIEKIKARVLEMMGEAARNQYLRNGVTRRP
ncbi:MAG TPA: DUF4157 domain-containing protein [Kofleriaceae bacterium]|nr:DUF4157 domain-containing protein [Kofleriaceae bacterium]